MTGSIGKIAEEVLNEVKAGKLIKLAEHRIIQEAPTAQTDLGRELMKLATVLRTHSDSISVEDLKGFLHG